VAAKARAVLGELLGTEVDGVNDLRALGQAVGLVGHHGHVAGGAVAPAVVLAVARLLNGVLYQHVGGLTADGETLDGRVHVVMARLAAAVTGPQHLAIIPGVREHAGIGVGVALRLYGDEVIAGVGERLGCRAFRDALVSHLRGASDKQAECCDEGDSNKDEPPSPYAFPPKVRRPLIGRFHRILLLA